MMKPSVDSWETFMSGDDDEPWEGFLVGASGEVATQEDYKKRQANLVGRWDLDGVCGQTGPTGVYMKRRLKEHMAIAVTEIIENFLGEQVNPRAIEMVSSDEVRQMVEEGTYTLTYRGYNICEVAWGETEAGWMEPK